MRLLKRVNRIGALWLLICIVAAGLGSAAQRRVDDTASMDRVTLYLRGAAQFERLDVIRETMEEQGAEGRVTGWAQQYDASVSSGDTKGSARVDAIWFDGTAADIFDFPLVSGSMPGSVPYAAAIDEGTAQSIFGSSDVAGKTLKLGAYTLEITGVFSLPERVGAWGATAGNGLAFIAVAGSEDIAVDGVAALDFALPKAPGGVSLSDATAWAQGASMSVARSDDRAYNTTLYTQWNAAPLWVMSIVALFALLMAAWRVALLTVRRAWAQAHDRLGGRRYAHTALGGIIVLIVMAGGAAAIWLLAAFDVSVPAGVLPTQWSALEFWPGLVTSAMQEHYTLRTVAVTRPDAYRQAYRFVAGVMPLIALFALAKYYYAVRRYYEKDTGRLTADAAYVVGASILAPVCGAALAALLGLPPVVSWGYTLLPFVVCAAHVTLCAYPAHWYVFRRLPVPGSLALRRAGGKGRDTPGAPPLGPGSGHEALLPPPAADAARTGTS